ncbi:uncharacterized protein LOC111060535 isoform X6 [Nilaparvata lugens]|uniref:uncharacterized protein LOC111060535 isoform X6 n=1 Tax=Nilaparvata lugens TaxID=108931 RepID=UPI00193C8B96|nr:uncharacterized protein LOC111060535 isoform X6 [Nilaparvata lugens]XP_039284774.1 uncharacterized protein LOC111060535 isoform X6 [Nilaparvata lugens]
MATAVVKQEVNSSIEPSPECKTAWCPINDDNDAQQRKTSSSQEEHVKQEVADECLEDADLYTVKSVSEMWPSNRRQYGSAKAKQAKIKREDNGFKENELAEKVSTTPKVEIRREDAGFKESQNQKRR